MASTVNKLISQYVTPIKDQSASRRKLYLNAIETNVELYAKDIAKKFNVDVDDVVGTIIEAILKSDKKHPSPKADVNSGANKNLTREYYHYLWEYYVNDDDKFSNQSDTKTTKQPDPPKVTRSRRVINSKAKKSKQFVKESIDTNILNALGLNDIKDFTYEEYQLFLKEYLIKSRIGNNKSTEDIEQITNEFKRVKGKSGQFEFVKKQKVNSKPFNKKIKGILPPAKINKKLLKPSNFDGGEELSKILKTLGSINIIFKDSLKKGTKEERKNRIEEEKKNRSKREDGLELGNKLKKLVVFKNILKPFESVLDAIKRFIFFTVLGKLFNSLIKWFNDPVNAKKVETLNRFIKDWWPVILAAVVLFLTPLGGFILTTLKIVKGLTTGILKLVPRMLRAIGGLKSLVGKLAKSKLVRGAGKLLRSPLGKVGLVLGAIAGTSYLANEVTGQNKAAKVQTENAARVQSGKALPVPGVGGVGDIQATPYGMLQGVASGGVLEDGYGGVESDTGVSVTGAGPDTQLIIAKPGEVVLTHKDQENIHAKTGFDVASYVGKRPVKKVDSSKLSLRGGGDVNFGSKSVSGYQWGGIVGGIRKRLSGVKNPLEGMTNPFSGAANALRGIGNAANDFRKGAQRNLSNIMGGGTTKPKPKPRKPIQFGGRPAGAATMPNMTSKLTKSQRDALAVLGKYESSSSGGYNAVNQLGHSGGRGTSGFSGDFTKMKQHMGKPLTSLTIAEIMKLQHDDKSMNDDQWIKAGKLHAVGKYQIVGNTLPELVKKANLSMNMKFTPQVQDILALHLMKERGISPWVGPSDKATSSERGIVERARTEPISGGLSIKPPSMSSSGASQLLRNNTNQSSIRPYNNNNSGSRVSTLPPMVSGGQSPMVSDSGGGMDFMFPTVPNSALTDRARILETYGAMVG